MFVNEENHYLVTAPNKREIMLPFLADGEVLEAEIWWEPDNRKKPPFWMWLTNRAAYFQSRKFFAVSNDKTITAIPIHKIRQVSIGHSNLLLQRLLGLALFSVSLVLTYVMVQIRNESVANVSHLPKIILTQFTLGIVLLFGARFVKVRILYQTNDGREFNYKYRSPLLISRKHIEGVYLQCATLTAWANLKGLRCKVSPAVLKYWNSRQASGTPLKQDHHIIRQFNEEKPARLIHFVPAVFFLILTGIAGLILQENTNPKETKQNWIFAGVTTSLFVASVTVPMAIRRSQRNQFVSKHKEIISDKSCPGVITHTSPCMIAVLNEHVFPVQLKIVRCQELDYEPPSRLPVGSRVQCYATPFERTFSPFVQKGERGIPQIIPETKWRELSAMVDSLGLPSVPALYYLDPRNSLRKSGLLWSTHTSSYK